MTSPTKPSLNASPPWPHDDRWRIDALITQSDSICLPSSDLPSEPWHPQTHPAARLLPLAAPPASESSRMRQQVKTLFRQFQEDSCQGEGTSSLSSGTDWRNSPKSPGTYANEPEPTTFFSDLFSSGFTPNTQLEQALTPVLHASMAAALTPNVVETSGTSLLGAPSSIWSPHSSSSRNGSPYDAPKAVARSPRANTPTSDTRGSPTRSKKAPAKGWWKTEICKFWREGGGCRNEANCRWAHGLHELRRLETPETLPDHYSPDPPPWTPTHTQTPSSPTQTQEEDQHLASWLQCPFAALSPENRPSALHSVWDSIRHNHVEQLEENVLVAGPPGLQINAQYWQRIMAIFSKPQNLNVCDLCGAASSDLSTVVMGSSPSNPSESLYVKCCDDCKFIVEEKCSYLNWNLIIIMNTPSNDNSRLHQWGLRFARLLRSIDDGMWTVGKSTIDVFDVDPVVDRWAQHERLVARASLLVKRLMDKLTSSRRLRLSTMEVVPGLSMVEWMAVAEQPELFVALLLSSFPLHKTSMPGKLLYLGVPLKSTQKQQQRMIMTSITSGALKPAASPSALSTGVNSPAASEETLQPPQPLSFAAAENDLDGHPTSSTTTTGDSSNFPAQSKHNVSLSDAS